MRVISGTAKGRKLKAVPGGATRPITDRAKVALFDLLGPEMAGASLLDLFAGTGSVGIEALSRGARRVVFVDHNALAIRTVRQNLELTRLSDRAQVVHSDAFRFLTRRPAERFEVIYVAPPQYVGLWVRSLEMLDETPGWLNDEGQIVVQIDPREYRPIPMKNLQEREQRRYGSTLLCFFDRKEGN
ncbi:MAG: 16S rRNA (guanine(966)-N(2))-methyltransferase RsmD [Anaerolineales bacterium]|jgi:16S rRNA (guanine(966)-N(2))-methyltransferase RsmD